MLVLRILPAQLLADFLCRAGHSAPIIWLEPCTSFLLSSCFVVVTPEVPLVEIALPFWLQCRSCDFSCSLACCSICCLTYPLTCQVGITLLCLLFLGCSILSSFLFFSQSCPICKYSAQYCVFHIYITFCWNVLPDGSLRVNSFGCF